MSLAIYNSLTRKKESLDTQAPGRKVGMYVCGPTVYDVSHIGHARSAFTFEMMRRYLEFRRYEVVFVRNVTDVDDKIIDRARIEGGELKEAVRTVSERYLSLYHEEMEKLGVRPPTEEPRATEYIAAMQEMISEILDHEAAYVAGGDVYFDIQKIKSYGKLSKRNPEEMLEGTRGEPSQNKRHPLDFALWKSAKPEEPSWESPWGPGRPGWHIECSTMSTEVFKKRNVPFVIHGGGLDLIFPHHENEIAQAEGARREFAKLWVHNGLLTVSGQKMAKSLGNFITLEDLFEKAEPEGVRFYFLQTHYRNPLDFSWEKLEEAKTAYNRFAVLFDRIRMYESQLVQEMKAGGADPSLVRYQDDFEKAMDDDLNTPEGLAVLFRLLNYANGIIDDQKDIDQNKLRDFIVAGHYLKKMGGVFSLFVTKNEILSTQEEELIRKREEARKKKDFQTADTIRLQLSEQGILLMDTAGGVIWRRVK